MLFPGVGSYNTESKVSINFGASKFVYDIEAHDWSAGETADATESTCHPIQERSES